MPRRDECHFLRTVGLFFVFVREGKRFGLDDFFFGGVYVGEGWDFSGIFLFLFSSMKEVIHTASKGKLSKAMNIKKDINIYLHLHVLKNLQLSTFHLHPNTFLSLHPSGPNQPHHQNLHLKVQACYISDCPELIERCGENGSLIRHAVGPCEKPDTLAMHERTLLYCVPCSNDFHTGNLRPVCKFADP